MEPQQLTPTPTVTSAHTPKKQRNNLGVAALVVACIAFVLSATVLLQNITELQSVKSDLKTAKQSLSALESKKTQSDEFNKVDTKGHQAIFLSSGKVYFGKITEMTPEYYKIVDIYYLQNGSATVTQQNVNQADLGNVSLVKLGCELHKPRDEMIVNRQQAEFWENLQSNGQVATAIKTFEKQNPNGQKCVE